MIDHPNSATYTRGGTPVARELLTKLKWRFGNGRVWLSESVALAEDGRIDGYSHQNERRWQYNDGCIELISEEGEISAILRPDRPYIDGIISFSGPYLFERTGQTVHVLQAELPAESPTVGCFFRTHFWNENVALAFDLLTRAWGERPIVAADQTRPFEMPASVSLLSHMTTEVGRKSLLLYPNPQRALWYNGDYLLYELFLSTKYDYVVMCEYDLCINGNLRNLVQAIITDGCDFVAANLARAVPEWMWYSAQNTWDEAEQYILSDRREIHQGLFSFVVISRPAALYLFSRRVQMGRAKGFLKIDAWPFCESFVPTELLRGGFKIASLAHYVGEKGHMTAIDIVTWDEARQSKHMFVHPVLAGRQFVEKLILYSDQLSKRENVDKHSWLIRQKSRVSSKADENMINEYLEQNKRIIVERS